MVSKCANPKCAADFDYRQGKFFRFHWKQSAEGAPLNSHSVQHFWLCAQCSEACTMEIRGGRVVLVGRVSLYPQRRVPRGMAAV